MRVALKEAKIPLLINLILAVLAIWIWIPLVIVPLLGFVAILGFFRDPERAIPDEPDAVVSAADGKVVRIDEVDEFYFTNKPMKRVAVFLSVFDVHINRVPFPGTIVDTHHHAGDFLDARHPEADLKNEAMNWLFQTERGNVVVRQIAGLIARRIVPWLPPGEKVERGQRFGIIKFGSRTDVFLPPEAEICVKEGDRVQGGKTIIARLPQLKKTEPANH